MKRFNTEEFISSNITGRSRSFFADDLDHFHSSLLQEIKGKNMLVIGGAGTIGSSFIKAALLYEPAKVVVIDINENGLTELVRDCRSRADIHPPKDFKLYPVSFGDPVFHKIFHAEGPFDIVANFSAHKHVRSEKDVFSIEAMLENNVFRAAGLLDLLEMHRPAHFFCVSTDKAANPVNVMGASKKLMEDLIMTYAGKFKVTTARFANVAFSNGSLLAGFVERMMKNQPIACPSDVRRFFVSPGESGEICLLSCILGQTGEIFFPKLSEQHMIRFADILPAFLNSFGFEPFLCGSEEEARQNMHETRNGRYPVHLFTSDTSGEKLYEEFYSEHERTNFTRFSSLGVISADIRSDKDELKAMLKDLQSLFEKNVVTKAEVVNAMKAMIPDFQHIETGLNLDQKM